VHDRSAAKKPVIVFLIDTREQHPLAFGSPVRTNYFSNASTKVTTLKEGDYSVSLDGSTALRIRLERKSLGDLFSCIGLHRERFEAELKRVAAYEYRGLIIEASLDDIASVLSQWFV
jgi:ERCC4-type nuclease